jgi:hypothetical protein
MGKAEKELKNLSARLSAAKSACPRCSAVKSGKRRASAICWIHYIEAIQPARLFIWPSSALTRLESQFASLN